MTRRPITKWTGIALFLLTCFVLGAWANIALIRWVAG